MGFINNAKIITYGKTKKVLVLNHLFDEAEKKINSFGMASNEELESREVFNSILNAIDIKNPKLWNELQTIISLYLQQSLKHRYVCNIRLTKENEEKFDILERKCEARYGKNINSQELLFNSLLILFNNEVNGVV
ncbi:MAG: hypothetical protein QXH07_01225 [Thermoplasmata archaeon]